MTRILLRALNGPALVLLTALGIALQTSFFQSWPFQYLQPDVVLLVTIWCALKRPFIEGGAIVLLIADIAELHGAAPQGFFLATYMAVFLTVRGLSRIVVIPNLSAFVTLTLFASIYWKLAGLLLLYLLNAAANQWRHTLILLFPGAIMEGTLGLWMYVWLEKFDWITYKSARSDRAMEDDLQLDPGME